MRVPTRMCTSMMEPRTILVVSVSCAVCKVLLLMTFRCRRFRCTRRLRRRCQTRQKEEIEQASLQEAFSWNIDSLQHT